jgi:hypothetical protein
MSRTEVLSRFQAEESLPSGLRKDFFETRKTHSMANPGLVMNASSAMKR